MTNIPILGWYDQKNVGDEAFKDVFRAAIRHADPAVTVSFHTPFNSLKSPTPDKVILGGGDVVRPFYLQKIPPQVKIFPLGVGLGYESELQLLKEASVPFALFRNLADAELAQANGINAEYCPDLTFFLNEPEPLSISFKEGKTLGVLLSDEISPTFERRESNEYLYYEFFKWELAAILDTLSEFYNICFIAFSAVDSINDHKVSLDIFRRMSARDRVSFITEPMSMPQALWVVKQCELVISMKFHGIMFAVNQEVPFINIAETRKTQQFCIENDLAQLSIPRYSLERERFLRVVKIAEEEQTRQMIRATATRLTELAANASRRQSVGSSRDLLPHARARRSSPLRDDPDLVEEEAERTFVPCSDSFRGRLRPFDVELQAATAVQQPRRQPHLEPLRLRIFTDKIAKVAVVNRNRQTPGRAFVVQERLDFEAQQRPII